jgi:4-aminobutyrate aminotransferase-like enzyme
LTSLTDDKLRAIIDESLTSRLHDHQTHIAYAHADPLCVERAELLYVWDKYRNQYLDFSAAWHPLGHAHPAIRAGIAEQLVHYGMTGPSTEHATRWPTEYAKMLVDSFARDSDDPLQVLYCDDEDDAMLAAWSLASKFTYGRSFGVHWAKADHDWSNIGTLTLDFVGRRVCKPADPKHHWGEVMDPAEVAATVASAKAADVVVIADERLTGYGRCGALLWGQQRYGVDADIIVIGGPGGGGLPFGAVIAPRSFFDAPNGHDSCAHGHTGPVVRAFAGNPVVCAAGAAMMAQIHGGLLEHVDDVAGAMHDALAALVVQFPDIFTAHHHAGLAQNIRCHTPALASKLVASCRDHGLLVAIPQGGAKDLIWLTPPLVISENEVRRGVDMIASACLDWVD